MSKPSEHRAVDVQEIIFPNGNQARAVFLSTGTRSQTLLESVLSSLGLPAFHNFMMIAGGAALMTEAFYPNLTHLFTDGIAHLAASHTMLIIDGGTQAGVMQLMGTGVAEKGRRSPLFGISPAGRVRYPGQRVYGNDDEDTAQLDPNHSHFVLVETDEWGGETATMYELAHYFSQEHSSIALLVNGGAIAIKEVLYNVRQQRPVIVLEGSGRAADDIAHLWREKPLTISNPELAEIIQQGNIHLFPASGEVPDFVQLIETLLQQR